MIVAFSSSETQQLWITCECDDPWPLKLMIQVCRIIPLCESQSKARKLQASTQRGWLWFSKRKTSWVSSCGETNICVCVSPEELFQVVTTAGGPGEVTGVTTFDPFTRHDVGVACASGMIVVVAYAHAKHKKKTWRENNISNDIH